MIDGFREAVIETVARLTENDSFDRGVGEVLRPLRSSNEEWPDAVLPLAHAPEEGLQQVGGAARAILASRGAMVAEPVPWEDELAEVLSHSPLPLLVERTRIPRPQLDRPPGIDNRVWERIAPIPTVDGPDAPDGSGFAGETGDLEAGGEPDTPLHGLHADESLLIGCLGEETWVPRSAGTGGPYDGWVLVGAIEQRRSKARHRLTKKDLRSTVFAGVELDMAGNLMAHVNPPIGPGLSVYQWFEPVGMPVEVFDGVSIPLVYRGEYDNEYVDDCEGQGLPSDMVVPSPVLVELLGLQPTGDLVLTDESGPAVALATWRADYSHSNYHQSYPQLVGAEVLMRPDITDRLIEEFGSRLTMRRHLCGQIGLRREPPKPSSGSARLQAKTIADASNGIGGSDSKTE